MSNTPPLLPSSPPHSAFLTLRACALLGLFAISLFVLSGCQAPPATVDSEAIAAELRRALLTFEEELNAGEFTAALQFYANDPRFAAYEDGQLQYDSWDKVQAVYSQLPSFGKGKFGYGEPDLVVLDASHAWLATTFTTSFGEPGTDAYFEFSGILSALLEHSEPHGWQMLKIHSSALREGGRN